MITSGEKERENGIMEGDKVVFSSICDVMFPSIKDTKQIWGNIHICSVCVRDDIDVSHISRELL